MQDLMTNHGRVRFRRRVAALAVASALAAAGTAQAFEIPLDNPDFAARWDNTLRYNLGVRAQSQDPAILGAPNFDDGDRNFGNGSVVTNRLDVLSEFDLVWLRKYGVRFSCRRVVRPGLQPTSTTPFNATANTLVNGLPVAGALSPYTKRYAKGVSGEWLDAFAFANFDLVDTPFNVKVGQHTVYWGDSLLLGGAIHGVSYAPESDRRLEGVRNAGSRSERVVPAARRDHAAGAADQGPVGGRQWFYNWQADRIPESGSYLTIQRPAQLRR